MFRSKLAILAVAVLAFALLSAAAGLIWGDNTLLGLGLVGLLLSAATWKSTRISAFLQVFIGIFGTEYVIFGAVVLLVRRGLWPEALTDFGPPSSLPVTVAVFGILVWAASHLTVIKSITRIADLYFDTPFVGTARFWPVRHAADAREPPCNDRAGVAGSDQPGFRSAINVRLSFFNRDWFNAIQEKNAEQFWTLLFTVFLFWAAIYIVIAISNTSSSPA